MILAALVLLAEVLHDPSNIDAQLDVDLLRQFTSHIEFLVSKRGYDLQGFLIGSSRLCEIASYAVSISQDLLTFEDAESDGSGLAGLAGQCKVGPRLSGHSKPHADDA